MRIGTREQVLARREFGPVLRKQVTNLLLRSQEFDNAYWSKNNATATPNAGVAPDGATTADKIVPTTALANAHGIFRLNTVVISGRQYTYSVFGKAVEYDALQITGHNSDGMTSGSWGSTFNLATGTVAVQGANSIAGIQPIGNGWYRCWVTNTADDATGDIRIYCGPMASLAATPTFTAFAGDATKGILLWQAQLVEGATPGNVVITRG